MNARVERSLSRIADEAKIRYDALLDDARHRTERAAGSVRNGKRPLKTLTKLGVDLSSLSHKTTAKVLKQQTKMMENQLDALAGRLRTAAQARSLTNLVRDQLRLIPENASQFVKDSRATLSIVADAGSNVRELFGETASELKSGPRPATKKKARRTAKKAAKTASSAKKRARKPKARAA